ncbi:MAG: DNA gyrase subunit B [Candidatus Staskawiczbacteria bacterium RIFCSPHIGHO2_02_FULL_42_22]|uniref:DNA gyrase subunit B n=1 Tax=Candidatus Staskawiczbacteria bacterium RIFCSPHIGHO2_02_FULL_42_22 TaxID=1802207 RepID=A0A1G2I496_9BACT|nr:MAG: DNA gyrase subunit B [Candidatus Staskawiczbacteria bacterium RIFCSPHIGHO2_02_FULL_42_22]
MEPIAEKKVRKEGEYGAKDIQVLKGLEPVRLRPGMYIGSTGLDGLHHLIWEIVDNCLDEAMAGYAKSIEIVLMENNRVSVSDDGRGIPVEKHPDTGKSTLETVLTTLHAGGKFGGDAYKVSGGLHGVGVSVVCALSTFMEAEIHRDGGVYKQEYFRGVPKGGVKKVAESKKSGTTITFDADPKIFPEIKYDTKKILNHVRQQAYLTRGVKIIFRDERKPSSAKASAGEEGEVYTFYFEGGVGSFVKFLVMQNTPRHQNIFAINTQKQDVAIEVAFQYTQEMECTEQSFANNIYTPEGGTHISGFRSALTRCLNAYARRENFLKEKDENFSGDDVREGLTAVVSVKIRNPQFEGQTKAKLGNPEAKGAVEDAVMEGLTDYLERNPTDARAIIENCLLATKARLAAKAARQTVLRKGILEGLALPGKLADCLSKNPEESELYIVEGDSAGGSSKMARDRRFQAILPLRGKILNVERARLDKMLANKEVKSLIIALGTAISEDFNLENLRYHRIIIMTDADVDGSHIRTLLLTLFYRYFKPIMESGYIYIAQPPLYKIQHGKSLQYAYTEEQRDTMVKNLGGGSVNLQRYKGLGEMNSDELWETTMNPENRLLLQVQVEEAHEADKTFDILMGEEVEPRKKFIQTHAKSVKNLDV